MELFYTADIFDLSDTGLTNSISTGCIPFRCASARTLIFYMLAYWHILLACGNGTKPSLMLLVTPVGFPAMTTRNVHCKTGGTKSV